ncbi:MAG: CHAD domain-containing protein, partial [Planctomycetales bacterium]
MIKPSKWIDGVKGITPIGDVARKVLRERLQAVIDFLPRAAYQWQEDVEHVHQLRVSTRRAAAAMRIFRQLTPKA